MSLAALATALATFIALGPLTLSCLDLSWREGVPCGRAGCGGALTCCDGTCRKVCPAGGHPDAQPADGGLDDGASADTSPADLGPADLGPLDTASTDGAPADVAPSDAASPDAVSTDAATADGSLVTCPADPGICNFCMVGCACVCGGATNTCCANRFGIPQCGGCP